MNWPEIETEPDMLVGVRSTRAAVARDRASPGIRLTEDKTATAVVTVAAPGQVTLMGEHASSYGRPSIAAALGSYSGTSVRAIEEDGVQLELPALGLRARLTWTELADYAAAARAGGQGSRHADRLHVACIAIGACLRYTRRRPRGWSVRIESPLPWEASFGGPAAIAVSTAAALLAWDGDTVDAARIDAFMRELGAYGGCFGLDSEAISRGGLVQATFHGGVPAFACLPFRRERLRRLQLYDVGTPAEAAAGVADAVRERLTLSNDRGSLLASMERATLGFGAWLAGKGDLALGGVAAVRDYERCLERLGVVPAPVRAAIRAIEAAGGAAKISGPGALTGSGAGALLVLWPGRPRLSMGELAGWERCIAPLGMPGLRITCDPPWP